MPEIRCGARSWRVSEGSNLLDALNCARLNVPYSCRAGRCHACLVRCVAGEPQDACPDALDVGKRLQGWRLACQCTVTEDLEVAPFDPQREGVATRVEGLDWFGGDVLRLRLMPDRPVRYRPGQHALLWAGDGIARPYSLASLPGEDPWLEFHLDCASPGAFSEAARNLILGDSLRLGQLHQGALHYDVGWQTQPLLLLAAGTGLAPLWSILREALRQGHTGPVRLLHFCRGESYLRAELERLAGQHKNLSVEYFERRQAQDVLRALHVTSRQARVLICGGAAFVEESGKHMFLAGIARGQILSDAFLVRQA